MKKYWPTTLKSLALLIAGAALLVPWVANAVLIDYIPTSVINTTIANMANFFLAGAAWFVTITGVFLNLAITVTTVYIKDIYSSAAGIQAIWITIRDLSSMFIIFALLYYAILTIVGKGGSKWNQLIVNIFLAGVLINFSLFFARIAVDASNLVSLQFYNAIAPATSNNFSVNAAFEKGGISNVFMSNLKIPTIYQNSNALKSGDVAAGIGFAAIGGIIMMVTAGLSFLAAAIAFVARTGILLFCMALSPLYFVGMIFPQVKAKVSDKIMGWFTGQLLFMPVYLFLLYIALRLISDPAFTQVFNPSTSAAASNAEFGAVSIGVILQYAIAILFINAPLAAAISMSGTKGWGMNWAPNWKGVSKKMGGFLGQHTVGRLAKYAADDLKSSSFAARNPNLAIIASKGLSKVSGAAFGDSKGGYEKRLKEYSKTRTEYGKKLGVTDKAKKEYANAELAKWEQRKVALENQKAQAIQTLSHATLTTSERKEYEKKLAESAGKLKGMQEAENKNKKVDYLEKEIEEQRKKEFADALEKNINPLTKAARKDAADAIRKEFKKDKADKILKNLAKEMKGEGGGDDEEKGGDKGGGGGDKK